VTSVGSASPGSWSCWTPGASGPLVTPGLSPVGADGTEEEILAGLASRSAEPWYRVARAAMDKIMAGSRSMGDFRASRPFYYGRWDETAQAHATASLR
jgi:hypothetical protein